MPAVNINLLPLELSAKSGVAKLAVLLKKLTVLLLSVFLLLGAISLAFIIIFSAEINSVIKANEALKVQISTLESAEQKNILVKDRLAKIKSIEAQGDILGVVNSLGGVSATLPPGVSISDSDIDISGRTKFSFKAADSSALSSLLAGLISLPDYKTLIIKTFTFAPDIGYLITLEAVPNE